MRGRIILDGSEKMLNEAASEASRVLAAGGVILYPTDTVYGLGCDSLNKGALEKIYIIKGRDFNKPIHSVVADLKVAEQYGEANEVARALAQKFLPGPLTLLLKRKEEIPAWAVAGSEYFGIRIPDNQFCLRLAKEFGMAYTSTSANTAGAETNRNVDAILTQLGERAQMIDLIVDTGRLSESLPSTIVSVAHGDVEIVREGVIGREFLQNISI